MMKSLDRGTSLCASIKHANPMSIRSYGGDSSRNRHVLFAAETDFPEWKEGERKESTPSQNSNRNTSKYNAVQYNTTISGIKTTYCCSTVCCWMCVVNCLHF